MSEIDSNLACMTGLNASSCNQSLSEVTNDKNLDKQIQEKENTFVCDKNLKNDLVVKNPKKTQQKSRLNSYEFKRQLFGGKNKFQIELFVKRNSILFN